MLTGAVANGLTTLFRGFRSPVRTSGSDLATAETATATPDRPANLPGEDSVAGEAEAGAAVVFDRVSLAFDEQVVLRDVSFQIPRGGMRILLGDSGAGKSVVLKLILGLLRPDAGAIVVGGQRVDTMPERDGGTAEAMRVSPQPCGDFPQAAPALTVNSRCFKRRRTERLLRG